jgi:hypothetical protein
LATLHHKLMALHIATATPVMPEARSTLRTLLEATLFAAFMAMMLFLLVIVGDA